MKRGRCRTPDRSRRPARLQDDTDRTISEVLIELPSCLGEWHLRIVRYLHQTRISTRREIVGTERTDLPANDQPAAYLTVS